MSHHQTKTSIIGLCHVNTVTSSGATEVYGAILSSYKLSQSSLLFPDQAVTSLSPDTSQPPPTIFLVLKCQGIREQILNISFSESFSKTLLA